MDEKYRAKQRLVVGGMAVLLLLALVIVSGTLAAEPQLVTAGPREQLLYEIRAVEPQAGQVRVALPAGWEFAGLAPGSQVAVRPLLADGGRTAIWDGPFADSPLIRFWLAPTGQTTAPDALGVSGAGAALRIEPEVTLHPTSAPGRVAHPLGGTVAVTKTVAPSKLELGDNMWVTYEVLFTNTSAQTVTLERITDTLPSGFLFGNPAVGDEVGYPVDAEEPEIVWVSATIPASGTLKMRYNVRAVERGGEYTNRVEAVADGERIGPVGATLTVEGFRLLLPLVVRNYRPPAPEWQLSKTPNTTEVTVDETVDYTVLIENTGDLTGTLTTINDALPEGMTFVGMLPDGDVTTPPMGTQGTITWSGQWTVPPSGTLTLRYRCRADEGGAKTNTVTIYSGSVAVGSASSTVQVGGALPFYEDFTYRAMENWEIFLNYPGLSAANWYWSGDDGVWGIYNYEFDLTSPPYEGYALAVYNDPGAQAWTDYRIEARFKDVKEVNLLKGLTGIWFRGTYQNSGAMDGKTVGGYYLYMKAGNDTLYLMRTPPDNPMFASQQVVSSYVYQPGLGRKHWYTAWIEVRGNNIKVWFGDEEEGMIKVFDWTDTTNAWPSGTVGLSVYNSSARFDYLHVTSLP